MFLTMCTYLEEKTNNRSYNLFCYVLLLLTQKDIEGALRIFPKMYVRGSRPYQVPSMTPFYATLATWNPWIYTYWKGWRFDVAFATLIREPVVWYCVEVKHGPFNLLVVAVTFVKVTVLVRNRNKIKLSYIRLVVKCSYRHLFSIYMEWKCTLYGFLQLVQCYLCRRNVFRNHIPRGLLWAGIPFAYLLSI